MVSRTEVGSNVCFISPGGPLNGRSAVVTAFTPAGKAKWVDGTPIEWPDKYDLRFLDKTGACDCLVFGVSRSEFLA